jgi:hypothetical protein
MSLSFDFRYNFSHSNDQYWERISLLFHLISNYIPAQFKDIKSEEALFRFFSQSNRTWISTVTCLNMSKVTRSSSYVYIIVLNSLLTETKIVWGWITAIGIQTNSSQCHSFCSSAKMKVKNSIIVLVLLINV